MTAARGRYRDRSWAELKEAEKVSPDSDRVMNQETRVRVLVPVVSDKLCDPSWVSRIFLGLGFSHLLSGYKNTPLSYHTRKI